MPTAYTARSVPTTSWSARPTPTGAITYGASITYEQSGIDYDGSGGFSVTSYATRSIPSAPTWNTRSPI